MLNPKYYKFLLVITVSVIAISFMLANSTNAKSSQFYSLSLVNGIDNNVYQKMTDQQKIDALKKQLSRKTKLLESLTENINNRKELSDIKDILDENMIATVKESINEQVDKILEDIEQEKDPLELSLADYKAKTIASFPDDQPAYGSIEENVEAQINQFVFDKSNIVDNNILYKISHDTTLTGVLKKALSLNNNIDIIARRWNSTDLNVSYDKISEEAEEYEKNTDIENYLACINLSDSLCNDHPGKNILISNVKDFIVKRTEELKVKKFEDEFNTAKENMPVQTEKLWVTSYNPACEQTKGGVMGKDGVCYATQEMPCAIGSNKGKTEGICGNPYIGAKGHDLKDLLDQGVRPLAVTQDLKHLIGKEVFLRCYDKQGQPFYDDRCNGYYTVYDYKNKRYRDSVDIFIDKDQNGNYNNIGGVDVVLFYDPNSESIFE